MTAACALFNGLNGAFYVGDVFVCPAGVQVWKERSDGFEFRVGKKSGDAEATMLVSFYDRQQFIPKCISATVWEVFNGQEF